MPKKNIIQTEVVRYNPNYDFGLTNEQIKEHQEHQLVNNVKIGSNKTILSIIIDNVFTFFNLMFVLIFVLLISANAPIMNFTFVIIITINTVIGIIQEIKTKKTIDKLSLQSQPEVKVMREGKEEKITVQEIVLDDIVCLNSGNSISTDSIIVKGEIEVNESQLTGESIPIKKGVGDTIYSGSFVSSGNCYAKVERVGKDNYIETISKEAKKMTKPKSEIMRSLKYLLRFVGIIFIPLGVILYARSEGIFLKEGFFNRVVLFFTSFFNHSATYSESVLSTSSALIGMIPSGLVLLTTIALAVGVRRLAKSKTLVQNIYCIEMLSHVDVVCLDKTGTITDGTMNVTRYIEAKRNEFDVKEIISNMNEALREKNATSKALEEYFGFSSKLKVEQVLPFKSENKYSAVTFKKIGTFVLGAPEFVLKSDYQKIEEEVVSYANEGLRVLALAHTSSEIKDDKITRIPKLVALILIEDRIRKEASETIQFFQDNNVTVKIISGDNPVTVAEVARRVGVKGADNYISLDGMSDEEVMQIANDYSVFGRVKPNQKKILVNALQKAKHTVAMTGDGVNDILALKEADCSIAMASGCDAVKNVAQIVLLDSNFSSMPKVVLEGRRVINNISLSASLYLVKTLFTMIIALLAAVGFLNKFLNGSGYPFIPAQLVLLEAFAIGIPSFVLALQPNTELVKGRFLLNVIRKSLPGALTIGIQVIIGYVFATKLGFDKADLATVLSFSTTSTCLLVLFMACSPFNKGRAIMFGCLVLIIMTIFTLSTTGVVWSTAKGVLIDFRQQFQYMPLVKDMGTYYDANGLLLAFSLSSISYVVIIIINVFINFITNIFKKKKLN